MEPVAVTRVAAGVDSYDLAPDGKSICFVMSRQAIDGDWAELRKKFDHLEYGHGQIDLTTIRKLSLETWREEVVVELKRAVTEMAASPDGKRLAIVSARRIKSSVTRGVPMSTSSISPPGRRRSSPTIYGERRLRPDSAS